jgi:hypothetical protein
MQQRLALPATAIEITRFTMFFQLRHVPPNGTPTGDLTQIILAAAPAMISSPERSSDEIVRCRSLKS